MNILKSIITVGTISLFASGVCHAQLGGAAPLPEIKKPAGPTLEETTKWLTQKFETLQPAIHLGAFGPVDYRNQVVFDSCDLSVVGLQVSGSSKQYHKYEFNSINLKELDPTKVVARSEGSEALYLVVLRTEGNREIIRKTGITSRYGALSKDFFKNVLDTDRTSKYPKIVNEEMRIGAENVTAYHAPFEFIWIYLPDLEVAERIGNAFKHAIELCQKKAIQEKAARPAAAKELF